MKPKRSLLEILQRNADMGDHNSKVLLNRILTGKPNHGGRPTDLKAAQEKKY